MEAKEIIFAIYAAVVIIVPLAIAAWLHFTEKPTPHCDCCSQRPTHTNRASKGRIVTGANGRSGLYIDPKDEDWGFS